MCCSVKLVFDSIFFSLSSSVCCVVQIYDSLLNSIAVSSDHKSLNWYTQTLNDVAMAYSTNINQLIEFFFHTHLYMECLCEECAQRARARAHTTHKRTQQFKYQHSTTKKKTCFKFKLMVVLYHTIFFFFFEREWTLKAKCLIKMLKNKKLILDTRCICAWKAILKKNIYS